MAHQREAIRELLKRTEATIGRYNSSYAQALVSDQRKLFNAVDGIVSMRNTPNSLVTPAAHARPARSAVYLPIAKADYATQDSAKTNFHRVPHARAAMSASLLSV